MDILCQYPEYKRYASTVAQLQHDNTVTLFYGIFQSVFCYAMGIQLFREANNGLYMHGVLMYIQVKKELRPNTKIQIWNQEQAIDEQFNSASLDGIQGFVVRYRTALGNWLAWARSIRSQNNFSSS
jgi:hypothetical protein